MGNILFLLGLLIIIGLQKTFVFFARPQKLKGTAAFVTGIVLILVKWAFVGFLVELYGIFVLFGDFFSTIAGFAGSVPGSCSLGQEQFRNGTDESLQWWDPISRLSSGKLVAQRGMRNCLFEL